MLAATEALDDDAFDAATRALLAAEGEAVEPDPADDLPPKFAAFVTAFATHEPMLRSASLIGVKRLDALLKAGKTKVAIVDCRPAEERAVSSIRDAAALGDVQFTDETDNNVAACAEAFEVNTTEMAACDLIVAVSSTGAASHVAAPLLREKANGRRRGRSSGGWWRGSTRGRWWTRRATRATPCTRGAGGAWGSSRAPRGEEEHVQVPEGVKRRRDKKRAAFILPNTSHTYVVALAELDARGARSVVAPSARGRPRSSRAARMSASPPNLGRGRGRTCGTRPRSSSSRPRRRGATSGGPASRDKSYLRWMPHVNLLYPFVEDDEAGENFARARRAEALASHAPFPCALSRRARFFEHRGSVTAWRAPRTSTR